MKAEISSLEEFNELPYIKSWAGIENFVRFSMDRTHRPQALLVCETSGKCKYFAIAYLTEHNNFNLPIYSHI
jgi:hypothetical protein